MSCFRNGTQSTAASFTWREGRDDLKERQSGSQGLCERVHTVKGLTSAAKFSAGRIQIQRPECQIALYVGDRQLDVLVNERHWATDE